MLDMWLLLVLMPVIVLVLRSRGIFTERVVAHPNTLSLFPPRLLLWQVEVKLLMLSWSLPHLIKSYMCHIEVGSCVQWC